MKIKCDICGGELVMLSGGKSGACKNCGMEHSVERIREMLGVVEETRVETAPVKAAKQNAKSKTTAPAIEEPEVVDTEDIEILDVEEIEILDTEDIEVLDEDEQLTESAPSDFVIKKRFGGSYELTAYTGNAQRVIFPDKFLDIANTKIFNGHDEIVELVFGGGFTNTACDNGLFAGLKNLKRVICNGDMLAFDGEFRDCKNLEEVTVSNAQIIQLNGAVFSGCTKLKSVKFDENAQMDIGQGAFMNCTSLETFVHPKHSVYFTDDGISRSAFEGCTSLCTVILADDTTAIHKDAFKNCTSLKSVKTHSGDTGGIAIHTDAFAGAAFTPERAGSCPRCSKPLKCTEYSISCNCGLQSEQCYD